jgi:acyl carrier protein
MTRDEINSRVKKVIAEVLEKEVADIGDDANFLTDLGATSIQSIRLVAGFEEEFNIEMDEDKSLQVQTVSEAVTFIGSYL